MRKDARKVAFSLIYEYFFTNTKDDLELEQFIQMTDADDTVFEIDDSLEYGARIDNILKDLK